MLVVYIKNNYETTKIQLYSHMKVPMYDNKIYSEHFYFTSHFYVIMRCCSAVLFKF